MKNNTAPQKTTRNNTPQRQNATHLIALARDWATVNCSTHSIDVRTTEEYKLIEKAKRKSLSLIKKAPKIVGDDCADELMEFSIPFEYLSDGIYDFMVTIRWFDELNMKPNINNVFYSTLTYNGDGEYRYCRIEKWFIDVFAYYELLIMRECLKLDFTSEVA